MNRAERERQQEYDDGDLDDEVFIKTWRSGHLRTYHGDEDCHLIGERIYRGEDRSGTKSMTRRDAQDRGLKPCGRCILGRCEDSGGVFDPDGVRCPLCGADLPCRVSTHLPDCPG